MYYVANLKYRSTIHQEIYIYIYYVQYIAWCNSKKLKNGKDNYMYVKQKRFLVIPN